MTIEMPAAEAEIYRVCGRVVIAYTVPVMHEDTAMSLAARMRERKIHQLYGKVGLPRKPRTTGYKSQSHHFNGHCQQIAAYTGDSFDDVKMHVKREAMSAEYPGRTTSWGEYVPQSEADASTVECALLIETAHRIASDLGVILREETTE